MRPDLVPRSAISRRFYATRREPTYVIRPQTDFSKVPKLLSEHCETTSLALGKILYKSGNPVKLHVKNDGRGVRMEGVRGDDPNDIFGGIGGEKDLTETIHYRAHETAMKVSAVYDGRYMSMDQLQLELLTPESETLIVSRDHLIEDGVAPELAHYEADPYFGQVRLLDLTFSQLIDEVRRKVGRSDYLLVD